MPKTNRDFLYALFEKMSGSREGLGMKLSFEQHFLPMFPKNKKLNEVIPDEEYEKMLAAAEKELPAFLHFLMTNKFPSLPPDFGTKN